MANMNFETIVFRLVCWMFPQVWHTNFPCNKHGPTLASSRALTTGWRNRWLKTCSKLGPMNQALNSLINWDWKYSFCCSEELHQDHQGSKYLFWVNSNISLSIPAKVRLRSTGSTHSTLRQQPDAEICQVLESHGLGVKTVDEWDTLWLWLT